MRQGTARALILDYFDHRSIPKLIRVLEFAGVPEAEPLLQRLRQCTRYHPCRMSSCPNCGPKLKAKARDNFLDRIVARAGRFPKDTEISFVSVDGPVVELNPDVAAPALKRFRRQIVKFQQRKADSTSWLGLFDVSLDGKVHFHGVVLHPELSSTTLKGLLEQSFPDQKQVKVSAWRRSQSLAEALQAVINYSVTADRHARVYGTWDGPERGEHLVHGPESAVLIAKRIVVIKHLAGRGVRGLRLSVNMKAIVPGSRVPELDQLQRTTKKRINNKSMLNREWAPRGVPGTHLGKIRNSSRREECP
jgi:hypothetical protein